MTRGLNFGMIRNLFHIKGILVHVFFQWKKLVDHRDDSGHKLEKN